MDTFVPKGNMSGPILPEFVLKMSITSGAKLMYSLLCWHAYDKDHCWPSYSTLAERMRCSINSVKNYIHELVNAKLVFVKKENCRSSKYFLLRPSEEMLVGRTCEHCAESESSRQDVNQPKFAANPSKFGEKPSNFGCLKNPNKQIQETPPPMPPTNCNCHKPRNENSVGEGDSCSDFEKVYAAYPRKEAKGLAKIAWTQLARKGVLPELAVILAAITRFSASHNWQRENGRFIPQLSNFLKGERWNDPLTEAEIQDKNAKDVSEKVKRKMEQEEEQRRMESEKRKAVHKPDFDAFAAKFKSSFHLPMVFGIWMYFRDKGVAPLASDVPENNRLGIMDFIKSFANHGLHTGHSILSHEKGCNQSSSCSGNISGSKSNCFGQCNPETADTGFKSTGEILKDSPFFMGLKTNQPKMRQAIAC